MKHTSQEKNRDERGGSRAILRAVRSAACGAVLFGDESQIREAVHANIRDAGGPGKHLLNLGHGVLQGTPEAAVATFVDAAKTA